MEMFCAMRLELASNVNEQINWRSFMCFPRKWMPIISIAVGHKLIKRGRPLFEWTYDRLAY
jgi:hypothetical protein